MPSVEANEFGVLSNVNLNYREYYYSSSVDLESSRVEASSGNVLSLEKKFHHFSSRDHIPHSFGALFWPNLLPFKIKVFPSPLPYNSVCKTSPSYIYYIFRQFQPG